MKHLNPLMRLLAQATLFISLLLSGQVSAQIAAWDFFGESSPASSTADVFNVNLSSSNSITRGAGAAASTGSNSFRSQGFKNDGISTANTDYFQVTLGAAAGKTLSLSTIDANFNGTSSFAIAPGVSHQFAYSLNGTTFTLIGSPQVTVGSTTPLAQINLSGIPALQNVASGTTITLRYYASGQTSTGGWGFYSGSSGSYGLAIGGTVAVSAANTIVQFANATSTVAEDAGSTNLALAITNPDALNSTTATISVSDPNGRLTSYSTSVTFPAGSSGNENVSVDVADNTLCDGDEDLVFTITGVTGGSGVAATGAQSTSTLTVTDDDVCLNTSVQFASATGTVNENDGTVNILLSITDASSIDPTEVSISATDPNGRLTSYSTTVTFPAGSSGDENVSVDLANNTLCDGDEDVVFTITAVTGGSGVATTGTQSTFTLTVIDDDVCLNTSVQFTSTTGTVNEGDGTVNIPLSITDASSINPTEVTISATDPNGRVSSFTSPVTFATGSSADENMSVTLVDNAICELNDEVTFTITGISGGEGTTSIGLNSSFLLTITDNDPLATPVATAPTVINSNDFTATWDAAAGATGYQLDVSTSPTFTTTGPLTVTEPFTNAPNAPAGWTFSGVAEYTSTSSSGLSPNSVKFDDDGDQIISPVLAAPAEDLNFWFKGNSVDANSALKVEGFDGTTWTTIDNIVPLPTSGTTQSYPGLIGNGYVQFRFTYSKSAGNLAFDDFTYTCQCGTVPDLLIADQAVAGTSFQVTGLDPLTNYYYRVRATGGACPTTGNSNTMNVTTAVGSDPLLTAGTPADFGEVCLNGTGGPNSFTLDGINLTADDVIVGPLAGYTFSTSGSGSYTGSITLTPTAGSLSETIWVTFTPVAETAYDGDIPVSGGGASEISVAVTGSGINTAATVTTGNTVSIGLEQAEVAGVIADQGCSPLSGYGIEYSTTDGFTPGTGTQVASTNETGGSYSAVLSGLDPCTTYYVVAYGTNGGGTAYGEQISFTTDAIAAPVATVPVTVGSNDFTATWDATAGATGYRLDVSTNPDLSIPSPGTTTIETFTGVGGGTSSQYLDRSWTGVDGIGWTAYKSRIDQEVFTGNEAIALKNETGALLLSDTIADGVSAISFDVKQVFSGSNGELTVDVLSGPGFSTVYTVGTIAYTTTASVFSQTFPDINGPVKIRVSNNPSARPAIDNLAFTRAEMTTPDLLPGYDGLSVTGTSQVVSGLNAATTYYYRVRAVGGGCPETANSNTMAVTTTAFVCTGDRVVVNITTDNNPDQVTWEIRDAGNTVIASGGPSAAQANTLVSDTVCLNAAPTSACYTFKLMDSFGDGITGGAWELRTTTGEMILQDEFASGNASPADPAATAGYGTGHSFCLPLGAVHPRPNECGNFVNTINSRVYATKVAGASQYEFEFSDPDAGFVRRVTKNGNSILFANVAGANPLTPGVRYFLRVRTDADGPMADAHFGSGCEMGLSMDVVQCTELISAPSYGHSCNEYRAFNSSAYSFIYAKPVLGATAYTFHIYIPGEPLALDTTITRSTYILQLKWPGTPMANGSTYNVDVKTTVNGLTSDYCEPSCTITIDNSYTGMGGEMAQASGSFGDAQLWPNPVADGRVNLALNGLTEMDQQIDVKLYDVFGKQVLSRNFGNSGSSFSTVLDLPDEVASGVYLVHITVNGVTTLQRLSIVR